MLSNFFNKLLSVEFKGTDFYIKKVKILTHELVSVFSLCEVSHQ